MSKSYRNEVIKREAKFANKINSMISLNEEDFLKQAEQDYLARETANNALLQAYDDKKLKSKDSIKKARSLKRSAYNKAH